MLWTKRSRTALSQRRAATSSILETLTQSIPQRARKTNDVSRTIQRGAAWSLSFAYDNTMPYNIAKYRILRIGERKIDSIITRCHLHTTASFYCGKTSTQKSRTSWIFPWCDWVWWSMASIQPCKSWAMIFGHFITDLKLFENKCLILWCLYFGYWLLPVFCKCVYWCLIFQNQSAETKNKKKNYAVKIQDTHFFSSVWPFYSKKTSF